MSPADGKPMTLPRLAEMKLNAEPIVMVTAYDFPSAEVAEAGGRRPRPGRRHRGDDGARPLLDDPGERRRDAGADEGRPAGLRDAAADRRPAVRVLRALQRAGDRDGDALRQGGGLRRGQARARRRLGRAGAGDRPRRDPGDGPRRPHPADGDRARRLQGPGQDRRPGGEDRRGGARPAGGGLLRDRLRGGARGAQRGAGAEAEHPGDRDRRRGRQPTARCSSGTTCSGSTAAIRRSSSSPTRSCARRCCARSASTRARFATRPSRGPEHTYSIEPEELEAFRRYLEHESLAGTEAFGGDWSATEI